MFRRLFLASAALAVSAPAFANDSSAELGTGGLTLSRSDQISMESEDLFISPDKVTVDYVFKNTADADVETIVAFPMPDIEVNPYDLVSVPKLESDNFLGFEVSVDGQPVKPELEQRAFAGGIEVTDLLKAQNVPVFPFGDAADAALQKLPPDVVKDWVTRGIITVEEYEDTDGPHRTNSPFWLLRSTYWWRTVFPANKEVKVSHRYTPSLGGTAGISFFDEGKLQGETYDQYKQKYCMDDAFNAAVLKSAKDNPDGYPLLTESRLSYILRSGGNWALGTIGKFKLTIDKGDEKNFVSFCGENVQKTGPTTFTMTAEDYYPAHDIDILLLTPYTLADIDQQLEDSPPAAGDSGD